MLGLALDTIDHLDFEPVIPCDFLEYERRCEQVAVVIVRTCSTMQLAKCAKCWEMSRTRPSLYCKTNKRDETPGQHFTVVTWL